MIISIDSADTSNRGDSLSSSEVMLASGDANEGGDGVAAAVVPESRLWREPCLERRIDEGLDRESLRHVKARLAIIEVSRKP